ncbi:MAG: hypothetical protein ACJ788_09660 [Ktedonobacteraceae bacterium]
MATSDVTQETYQRRFIALFTQAIARITAQKAKAGYQHSLQDAYDDLTLAYQAMAPGEQEEIAVYKEQEKAEAAKELREEFHGDTDAWTDAYKQLLSCIYEGNSGYSY